MRLLIFFSLLLPFFFLSCQEVSITQTPQTFESDSLYYLALGDSYTIGHSVSESQRFPIQLRNSLTSNSFEPKEVKIIATTGWTTSDLQQGIKDAKDLRTNYDLVSLLIGVNNQYRGYALEEYKVEFRELLEQAITFAGDDKSRVFIVSIPDYAFTPFGNGNPNISQDIDSFNLANKTITAEYDIKYFDITPISRRGLDEPELVASDGLHPSGEQYREWVALMLEEVKEMVK